MRIVQVNDIASVASEITGALTERGHDVTLIRPRLVGGKLHWMVKPVVGPVRALEWAQIIHTIRSGSFDLVHIHYAYLGMLGVLGKFPYLLHCHGSDVREANLFTRPLNNEALKEAGQVLYATPDLADYVLPHRPDAEFLPNPVDVRRFAPSRPASESNSVFIACALTEIKGANRILDAVRELARTRPDIRFTAYEDGEWAPRFAKLPNVRLIPHQQREALPEIISQHGVVLGQVLLGAIGMAELEAMACARPLVAWFSFNRAYPVPPPMVRAVDGLDIATAVARLVDDAEERRTLGEAARAWVAEHHSVVRAAERVERAALALAPVR